MWPANGLVPDMTYNVFGGTLNLAQLNPANGGLSIGFLMPVYKL